MSDELSVEALPMTRPCLLCERPCAVVKIAGGIVQSKSVVRIRVQRVTPALSNSLRRRNK